MAPLMAAARVSSAEEPGRRSRPMPAASTTLVMPASSSRLTGSSNATAGWRTRRRMPLLVPFPALPLEDRWPHCFSKSDSALLPFAY